MIEFLLHLAIEQLTALLVSQHLSELKDAGLIQGTIEMPKVKYCINRENWQLAQELFKEFFAKAPCKKKGYCGKD